MLLKLDGDRPATAVAGFFWPSRLHPKEEVGKMETTQHDPEILGFAPTTEDAVPASAALPECQVTEVCSESASTSIPAPVSIMDGTVRISLDRIVIDGSIFPRGDLDHYTIRQYAAALIRGEQLPPITVEVTSQRDYRILKGVLRFEAYRLRSDIYKGNLTADFYDEPLPEISDEELNTISCHIDTVPPGQHPLVFCLLDNLKHGKPLTGEDYRKVARQLYKDRFGAPITGLAKSIRISRNVFMKYVADLVESYVQQRSDMIRDLVDRGVPQTTIGRNLNETFPYGEGNSQQSVSNFVKTYQEEKEKDDNGSADTDEEWEQTENEDSDDDAAAEKIEEKKAPTKPVELKVICGAANDTIMITGLSSLAIPLQKRIRREVEKLVNEIREKNRDAHRNDLATGQAKSAA